ncbi:MAG: TetR/AcrR family transcriptional regulator [Pseudomonadales bacterium]|nr:TetR/AcrR family transcriptional regulator [Pseudomonadales bacterium]
MKTFTLAQKERRERILQSARDQLSRLGYEGLNMRDLAVEANVSTSTLYNLYQSKDTLILAALQDLLAGLNEAVVGTGVRGVERCIANAEAIADQIVDTPRYAEAMAKMLFAGEQSDPIVRALLGTALEQQREMLNEMLESGEMDAGVDTEFIARSMTSTGWSAILLWMKGYVALHDFKREYVRNAMTTLLPWLLDNAEQRVRKLVI